MTITELAETYGRKPDTLQRKAKDLLPLPSGGKWSIHSAVTEDEARIILGDRPAENPAPVRRKKEIRTTQNTETIGGAKPAVEQLPPAPRWYERIKWPTFGLSGFLGLVIYGHTALVWYELADIFVTPGIFAGVILAAMKHAAIVVTRSGKYPDAVHHAISVAFLLDVLAWYVHYRSFFNALRVSRYMNDMGQDSYTVAKVLAGVLCAGAFAALFLIYKLKYTK